ncbi:MAG: DUF2080 family transposase-associated protein [Thermodesulfobacteriota bacterium]
MEKKSHGSKSRGSLARSSGRLATLTSETGDGVGPVVREEHVSKDVPRSAQRRVKFEVYGQEMLEKVVKYSGNSGRVYLPPEWVGKRIKIIRAD